MTLFVILMAKIELTPYIIDIHIKITALLCIAVPSWAVKQVAAHVFSHSNSSNSDFNSTFKALNLFLLTDSKIHNAGNPNNLIGNIARVATIKKDGKQNQK